MKILVPIDPSSSSLIAVTKAVAMAKLDGSSLTLLAVAETFEDMESLFGAEATERMNERATKALDAAKALAADAKTMLKTGVSPEDIICDAAEKGGFDLIVMGTRSKKGNTGLRLGSVASKVAALAHCSVMVVR